MAIKGGGFQHRLARDEPRPMCVDCDCQFEPSDPSVIRCQKHRDEKRRSDRDRQARARFSRRTVERHQAAAEAYEAEPVQQKITARLAVESIMLRENMTWRSLVFRGNTLSYQTPTGRVLELIQTARAFGCKVLTMDEAKRALEFSDELRLYRFQCANTICPPPSAVRILCEGIDDLPADCVDDAPRGRVTWHNKFRGYCVGPRAL
jgi:hypothetical protein